MSEHTPNTHSSTDGLGRWLLGGLAAGGIVLGLLIAAYAIGYHHGQHHPHAPTVASPAASTTTTAAPSTPSSALGPVVATPVLVARGKTLYSADGCSACHSLTGTAGVGPSFKGVASSQVTLANGQTVTADDAYLEQSITNADAQIGKGYNPGIMPAAIASSNLAGKPNDIRALVAFIKAQK